MLYKIGQRLCDAINIAKVMTFKIIQILKQSILYTLPGIASQIMHVILIPIYTRIFVPAEYGVIVAVDMTLSFTSALLMLAIEQAVIRYYYEVDSAIEKRVLVSTALFFIVIFSFTVIVVLILVVPIEISNIIFQYGLYSKYFIVGLATVPFGLCYKLELDILRLKFQVVKYVAIRIAYSLLISIISLYLVLIMKMGIIGIFIARLVVNFIFSIIVYVFVRGSYVRAFSIKVLIKMLKYCTPLIPASITFYAYQYTDRYLLIRLSNLNEVGLYTIAVTVSQILILLVQGFRIAWVPTIYSMHYNSNDKQIFKKIFKYFWAVMFFCAMEVSIFSKEVINILCTDAYITVYRILPILVLSSIFFWGIPLFSFGIGIAEKTKYNLIVMLIAIGLNIGFNLFLIPRYGMEGAAVATLSSALIYSITLFVISQYFYHIDYDIIFILKLLIPSTCIIFVCCWLISDINYQNILIKICLTTIYLIYLYKIGLFNMVDVRYVRKSAAQMLVNVSKHLKY